ncbi:DUF6312 domain-containing protein [Massilia pseudoviolaceinigra]|uniref:DUF6312 domain-containing protein n=1 Tax=Massilia pseudoviolaceinigra TaxID=3057165 RepID=UPI002796E208|nr:hypothetical protein [Massilia sp. CCM 9206]MDQ1919220.1 hypothetical protein [Massilia sp. CCM 9206]
MSELKLDPIVGRITILRKDAATGHVYVATNLRNLGRKKRSTKLLRPLEKLIRRVGKAQARSAVIYTQRHETSNRKKKNGWLYDMMANMRKAQKQAWKSTRK